MDIIDTKPTNINDIVYVVTDAKGVPIIDRSKNACAVLESFISEGAICYRVCGPIPIGCRPITVEYFTRVAHFGDTMPWEACDGVSCHGDEMQYQADTSTLCGRFWLCQGEGDGELRDLLVKVTLAA